MYVTAGVITSTRYTIPTVPSLTATIPNTVTTAKNPWYSFNYGEQHSPSPSSKIVIIINKDLSTGWPPSQQMHPASILFSAGIMVLWPHFREYAQVSMP